MSNIWVGFIVMSNILRKPLAKSSPVSYIMKSTSYVKYFEKYELCKIF